MDERVFAADSGAIARAAAVVQRGGLVAFPTETVYGLGADARDPAAVARIFMVKGRPADHPLIVHIASAGELDAWAADVPALARTLAASFWPGPLTLVLRRAAGVLDAVTGGQDTVGLRVPSHPVALALLAASGRALAAPSANRFGRVSPTTAQHVREDLGDDVELILDGGPCAVGVESTIVDLSGDAPAILRPGGLAREALEAVAGDAIPVRVTGVRASGTLESHYAPRAALRVVEPAALAGEFAAARARGTRVEVIAPEAETLYAALRDADRRGAELILVARPEESGLELAVADRLRRASRGSGGGDP